METHWTEYILNRHLPCWYWWNHGKVYQKDLSKIDINLTTTKHNKAQIGFLFLMECTQQAITNWIPHQNIIKQLLDLKPSKLSFHKPKDLGITDLFLSNFYFYALCKSYLTWTQWNILATP